MNSINYHHTTTLSIGTDLVYLMPLTLTRMNGMLLCSLAMVVSEFLDN